MTRWGLCSDGETLFLIDSDGYAVASLPLQYSLASLTSRLHDGDQIFYNDPSGRQQ